MLDGLLWMLIAFFSGSIPFSVLVGRWALGKDIRQYGDQNPGGTNVIRAGSVRWGILAILLDAFKAVIPVMIAFYLVGVEGIWLVLVSVAPIAGHAFSPFLGFKGGKAVAATFGVWGALTLGEGPILLGIFLGMMFGVVTVSGWAVILTLVAFGGHLALNHPAPVLIGVWTGNFMITIWKHRQELQQPPGLRRWILRRLPYQQVTPS